LTFKAAAFQIRLNLIIDMPGEIDQRRSGAPSNQAHHQKQSGYAYQVHNAQFF